jgi:uncharacterized protein YhjY with autotransporter beta-barrel domain
VNAPKKLIQLVGLLLLLLSAQVRADVISFSPVGGTYTVDQTSNIFWDMMSNSIGTTQNGSYVGGFLLSDHGDFHFFDYPDSNMVVLNSNSDIGANLVVGSSVGASSNFSNTAFAWTTDDQGGVMTKNPATTGYFGLKFVSGGNTYYGYVNFIEDVTTQSLVCWAYESTAGNSITIANCSSAGLSPSSNDTISSMTPNAYALRGAFAGQSAIINTGLSYDCTTFDAKGICVSAGGRVTDTNNPSINSQGALLIASYRANEQWRIGGYLDQNLSSNDARGVNLDNNNPMGGVFAVWNQNTDGTGYQVRLASGYSDKDVTISRSAFGLTGEAGKGDSSIQSQAYSATLSRGFQLNNTRWIASPYLGVRYTKIKRAGYTEDSSADVTTPLTYSALSQETTTALVGVRFNGQLGDKINLMASAGIENDIAHNTGDYAATGVDGLTPISFNQNIRHIRPVASVGSSYAIDKRQTVGANLHYRQEAFNSTNSVSGMVTYQVGF